jgi:subtilisin
MIHTKQAKLKLTLVVLLAALMLLTVGGQALAQPEMVRVIIMFKQHAALDQADGPLAQITSLGGKLQRRYHLIPAITVQVPRQSLNRMRALSGLAFIEEDQQCFAIEETLPWGVDRIDADLVHPYNKGTGVKVAIIDSGIDLEHPDLQVYGDVSFISGTINGDDDYGHGTHVAGTVAALDNDIGVIGVAPEAHLYAVKVLSSTGSGYWSDVIAGIEWSVDHDMQVINMSLGGTSGSTALQAVCNAAEDAGIVVVAAAGNSGNSWAIGDRVLYPARYDSVIAVAATTSSDVRAYFSSTGPAVELAAPGYNILSTAMGGGYVTKNGTSMASPHVVGVASLVITSGIEDTNSNGRINDEVRVKMQQTAIDLGSTGRDNEYGYGLVYAPTAAPLTNHPPVLSSANVAPSSGNGSTSFLYEVTYTDADNDSPDSITLIVNGVDYYPMGVREGHDGDFTNGEVYEYTLNGGALNIDNNSFQFAANDGTADAVGETGPHDGPTIINNPPGAPVVDVTPNLPATTDDLVATITSPSIDPDGDDITYSYKWYINDEWQEGLSGNTTAADLTAEGETWRCEVTPNDGHVNGDSAQDQVTIQNSPPVANAGPDKAVTVGTLVTLDGSGSWDPDALDSLTYTWTQLDGDLVALSDNTTAVATFTPGLLGTYTFELVVYDGTDYSPPDGVLVIVGEANNPPVLSSANVTPPSGDGSTFFLYEVTYTDADNDSPGSITLIVDGVYYPMGVRDGEDGDFTNGEIYEYTLSGQDLEIGANSYGFAADDGEDGAIGDTGPHAGPTVTNSPPGMPGINITPDPAVTTDDLAVGITSPSVDPDGDDVTYSYRWYRNDEWQEELTGNTVPSDLTAKGETWRCEVTPNDGHVNGDSAQDVVTIQNSPPVADAGPDQAVTVDTLVTLDGSGSWDPDVGDSLTYAWTQVDGDEVSLDDSTAVGPTFTPHSLGTCTFRLVVYDGTAYSTADEVVIDVDELATPTIRVDSINMVLVEWFGGWLTYARATVCVVDGNGAPVEGTSVLAHWEGATTDTESGNTDANGEITFTSNYRRRPSAGTEFILVIDSISKPDYEWDETNSIPSGVVAVP